MTAGREDPRRGAAEPAAPAPSPGEPKGPVGTRKEMGSSGESQKHPPHVTENVDDAPLQQTHPSDEEVPALGANASGKDRVSTEEQDQPIDPESMYEQRPEESKRWDPGEKE